MKKSLSTFAKPLPGIIHKFSIQGKYKLAGSNSFRGMLYPSDIDVVSDISEPAEALAHHFQQLFSKPLPFYFMDFKAGRDEGKPDKKIRWTPSSLAEGKIKVKGGYKTLANAIREDMLVKLDFIVPVGNSFAEVSEIYITPYQSQQTKSQAEESLEEDIVVYSSHNTMKALKRLYALLLLQNTKKTIQKRLVDFFNSEYGLLNKIANDLELLVQLTQKHKVDVTATIQMLKQKCALTTLISEKMILELDKGIKVVPKVVKYIRGLINPVAKELLAKLHKN